MDDELQGIELFESMARLRMMGISNLKRALVNMHAEYWYAVIDIYGIKTYREVCGIVGRQLHDDRMEWKNADLEELKAFVEADKKRGYMVDDSGARLSEYLMITKQ